MKMVKLNMVAGGLRVHDDESTGEDDGITELREVTKPVILDADQVRNFYPRKGERIGTRILFRSGSAIAVTDLFNDVEQKIRAALAA